jgi:hypothetical protein
VLKELMDCKTLAMTTRHAQLSTAHRIAVVRMLDAPTTSTDHGRTGTSSHRRCGVASAGGGAGIGDGPCWTRTNDPLLKRQLLYHLS